MTAVGALSTPATTAATTAAISPKPSAPPPWIHVAVRDVLERAPNYGALTPPQRQALAKAMVKVSTLAAELIAEEGQAEGEIERRDEAKPAVPLATAQSAQPGFGESADRIAGITRNVLNAVSFPRFVGDLINGVFKAMLNANAQQMNQYVQLLNAVSASAEGFERTQFGLVQVRQWVADHFPESIEYDTPDPDDDPDPEEIANIRLRLRSGASMPGEAEIRATLGVPPEESIEASNPEQMVPFARRYLARQRQQQLATMVKMGMQRIVIDSGRINASMRFHIDTRSAAAEDRGSQFGMQNRVKASGSFGVGPWGASAEVENTISYVSTERTQRTEEINTDLELNSSVELNFHTDYLPLNQMAAQAQADRIRNSTLNPAAEIPDPTAARAARLQAQQQAEQQRRTGVSDAVAAASRPATATPPAARTPPATGTPPATLTPPATGTTPAARTPPGTGTPSAARTPPATSTPPAAQTPPATGTPPSARTSPATSTPPPATRTPPATGTSPAAGTPPATGSGGAIAPGTAIGDLIGDTVGDVFGGQSGSPWQ